MWNPHDVSYALICFAFHTMTRWKKRCGARGENLRQDNWLSCGWPSKAVLVNGAGPPLPTKTSTLGVGRDGHGRTDGHTANWEDVCVRGSQTPGLYLHGFLAGWTSWGFRYGLFSASILRLYFCRPPRTLSRRTPVGRDSHRLTIEVDIFQTNSIQREHHPWVLGRQTGEAEWSSGIRGM